MDENEESVLHEVFGDDLPDQGLDPMGSEALAAEALLELLEERGIDPFARTDPTKPSPPRRIPKRFQDVYDSL